MKKKPGKNRSGESIVEVMVSAAVFLLLMAVLQGAVLFCNSAQKKSQQIRKDTAEICKKLPSAPISENGSDNYVFYAVSADGTVVGDRVFSISAKKQKKEVSYEGADGEASSVTFYLFGTDGGSSP